MLHAKTCRPADLQTCRAAMKQRSDAGCSGTVRSKAEGGYADMQICRYAERKIIN
jgi:hypothetical protein